MIEKTKKLLTQFLSDKGIYKTQEEIATDFRDFDYIDVVIHYKVVNIIVLENENKLYDDECSLEVTIVLKIEKVLIEDFENPDVFWQGQAGDLSESTLDELADVDILKDVELFFPFLCATVDFVYR